MMRLEDAWRSLKRLTALVLPEPWQIRLESAQYAEEDRPLAIIDTIGDLTRAGVQPTIPGRQHVVTQTFLITAYPPVPDDPRVARETATKVLQALDDLVTIGWVDDTGKSIGGPLRLPMWDYETVPLTGPARANPNGDWPQMMWVETHTGRVIGDPQDDRRWTVPYTLRLSWDAASRIGPYAPIADKFGGVFVAAPLEPHPEPIPTPGPTPSPLVPIVQGPAGPPGPTGVRGDQMWQGHGPPDSGQLPQALPGDEYLDLDTGDVYQLG